MAIVLERNRALKLAGGTLLALIYSAAACGLNTSGADVSSASTAGGGGQAGGPATSASGTGGSLTISSSGSVASGTGGDGGAGGDGGNGGNGAGGEGGAFVCEGDGVFEDPVTLHCYRYVMAVAEEDNWLNTQASCKTWGGPAADLAAISSLIEYTFIVSQLGDMLDMWLGGRNLETDIVDEYVWSNGEPWAYAPDGALPANDPSKPCIKMKNLAYQPKACAESHKFLCERY
jgi:hypothetical protein